MKTLRLLTLVVTLCFLASACGRLEPLSTARALARLNVATSKVYDASGNVIADLHGEINRDSVPLSQIPVNVQNAAIAVEDERFWSHQGIDLRSLTRAIASDVKHRGQGDELQGGSTISQQLAKNLYFPHPARTLSRKIAEARVTYELEQTYSKARILEMYLNTIYLGRGVYGIETAAHSYFGKDASQLTLAEGAFLTGLIHEPARYEWTPSDPPQVRRSRIADAQARRNFVLERMRILRLITPSQATSAEAEPLTVKPPSQQRWTHPYFVDYVLRELGVFGNANQAVDPRFDFLGTTIRERSENVYRDGLRIYTTLDPTAQAAAESAVASVLPTDLDRLSAALVAIEPANGYVRALVGGRDYYPTCTGPVAKQPTVCRVSHENLALGQFGGGGGRQPGSSFKPFVLSAALERGIPLYNAYDSSPFTYTYGGGTWDVGNYEGEGGGPLTLVDATAHSVNAVFAHLLIDGVGSGDALAGAQRVATLARSMGVQLPTPDQLKQRCGDQYMHVDACLPADDTPSIALGSKEVAPIDMASAYATFANDGVRFDPTSIVRITDDKGKVLYNAKQDEARVLPSGVARGVTYALQQVIKEGTGTAAAIDRPAAGKTGTSENWTNAWFDGYVPQLAASVWVGNPITSLESMTPENGYPFNIVGGTYPAEIWHAFMTKALAGMPVEDFRDPPQQLFSGNGTIPNLSPTPLPTTTATSTVVQLTPKPARTKSKVPNVVGLALAEANNKLTARGYVPADQPGCDPSGKTDLNDVYAQSPGGGSKAPSGTQVTVNYQGGGCH
jgi:penicillin-binding protein 1A